MSSLTAMPTDDLIQQLEPDAVGHEVARRLRLGVRAVSLLRRLTTEGIPPEEVERLFTEVLSDETQTAARPKTQGAS